MITKINYKRGKQFKFANHINEFLVSRENTRASETFLVIVHPKKSTHLHKHSDMEQVFFGIKGRGIVYTKKSQKIVKIQEIKPGDVVFVPINQWHSVATVGNRTLEYLCFNAFPKGHLKGEGTALDHAKNVLKKQLGSRAN